jgi:hypothetical protein
MELGLSRSAWTGSVSRDGAIDDCRLLGELSGDALESLKKSPSDCSTIDCCSAPIELVTVAGSRAADLA